MPSRFSKQWPAKLISLLFFFIVASAIEYFHAKQLTFLKNESYSVAKKQLSIIRSRIEATIVSDMYILNNFSTLVTINPNGDQKGWDQIAQNIIRDGFHIRLIGLAENDVLNFVYPLEGNEQILGIDYRDHPIQWESVEIARNIGNTFIAGPFDLFQGGQALITRTPIFRDPPFNQNYWGVSSAVIDLDALLEDVGVGKIENKYNLAIRGANSAGKNGEVFYGTEDVFTNAFTTEQVNFPYGGWYLALSGNDHVLMDVPWSRIHSVRLIGYGLMLILMGAYFMIYRLYRIADSRSMHDELTMLPNRRYFMYSLKQAFKTVQKQRTKTFAVVNIDLDGFKAINDTYGHAAGDKVLIECAKRIKSMLRTSDIVARIGGDEFLVLLPRIIDEQHVATITQKLQGAICETPVVYEAHSFYLRISVGWVIYDNSFNDVDGLLKAADEKMYEQKRQIT
ncbi:Sensor domain-containing diguanylate cyclase [Vibrio chagasii]|uniref:diguanylate cyclase domain-containing protein n=1 Tax=Vibrio sp. 070316B TaxID=2607608 RepID=UPI001493550B|nr:diguanylate cyclase [Vibrio sp. 070316B]CAH6798063.1 Sensor domain-containing diguanylate cyclase [Vibrio chagasii]NOI39931.1 sensor domain-containing diguanylate cyclase [Vibrio sp. 070316B]CAH6807221.1 Sensor domain-containing diguanylate cyclase [Vibrio chagasii]CAH6820027.1 Sensor domain-containing diguanylate cyclase [Vibrio chagasii]CAH6882146.1 Sensor domain-containing diguanylate cyclase [Vibrio chagasii]